MDKQINQDAAVDHVTELERAVWPLFAAWTGKVAERTDGGRACVHAIMGGSVFLSAQMISFAVYLSGAKPEIVDAIIEPLVAAIKEKLIAAESEMGPISSLGGRDLQ